LVGRGRERRLIAAAAEQARAGRPSVLLVAGGAGEGKSALLRAVAADLVRFRVLWAEGFESRVPQPYALLDGLIPPAAHLTDPQARLSPFAAAARVLAHLGKLQAVGPVAVVIDDLHCADEESGEALAIVARRLRPGDQVLMLAATRPLPAGTQRAWRDLQEDRVRCTLLRLSGLSKAEVLELARRRGFTLDQATARRLSHHVAGNPLYAVTLLEEAPPETWSAPDRLPAPRRFAEVIAGQFGALPEPGRRVVAALAVLGRPGSPAELATLYEPGDAQEGLTTAEEARLVEVDRHARPPAVRLTHPLIGAAVLEAIPDRQRRTLHARAAEISTGRAAVEHRVAAADRLDPHLAEELDRLAWAAHTERQHRLSAQYYQWSHDLSDTSRDRERLLLNSCLEHLADLNTAPVIARLDVIRDCTDLPRRNAVLAGLAVQQGRPGEAVAGLREAVRQTDRRAEPDLYQRLVVHLAEAQFLAGSVADFIASTGELDVDEIADPVARGMALSEIIMARGAADGGRATDAELAARGFPDSPHLFPPSAVDVLIIRGCIRGMDVGELRSAVTDLEVAAGRLREGFSSTLLGLCHAYLSQVLWLAGRWPEAETHAELALDVARGAELHTAHAAALYVAAGRGDWTSARKHLRAAASILESLRQPVLTGALLCAAVSYAHASGDTRELRTVFGSRLPLEVSLERARGRQGDYQLAMYGLRMILLGQLGEAREILQGLPLTPDPPAWVRMLTLWVRGLLLEKQNRIDEALDCLREATEVRGDLDEAPLFHAHARRELGRLLATTGHRRLGVDLLHTAHDTYRSLGAVPFVASTAAALKAAGARSDVPGIPAGLEFTARERQIADLVGRGLTNREIGSELYVSEKTVEYHLGNVFAKYGINSRRTLRDLVQREASAASADRHG
jgi:DNA-binding CsgD family transcriptional regulator